MHDLQCEFCTTTPVTKFKDNNYVRYCCKIHEENLKRVVYLDLNILYVDIKLEKVIRYKMQKM